jgi:hypothetical protein
MILFEDLYKESLSSPREEFDMTRVKHVLILIILILPMSVLAPSLVASQNEAFVSQSKVDTALPAQFTHETLRVAVYAESNTTLPAYATGGVFSSNYQSVINLLVSAGYAVTALTTQDILEHKLMVADYDAFVLPNQLPRESIINLVKDYWLGGGGVLSFDGSIGYCFYAGFIDPSLEGGFELTPPASPGYWALTDLVLRVNVTERHPVTKAYTIDDVFSMPSGNFTIVNGVNLPSIVGNRMHSLVTWNESANIPLVVAFDNPNRGGKIVQVPTGGSSIPSWLNPIIIDAIDWLAPRPKGRVLFDLTHMPLYGVDSWDSLYVADSILHTIMRDILVNHTYTLDKLYPSSSGNLTASNLDSYDILIVIDPAFNFTAQEVAAFTNWVNSGGSFLSIADHIVTRNQNMNYLLSNMDLALNLTLEGTNSLVPSGNHPTHEGCSDVYCLAPGSVAITGSAFSLWEDATGIPVIGGEVHGNGRVILVADGAILRDGRITAADNAQALINFANWLSSATANVLVYTDQDPAIDPDYNYYRSPVATALNSLGVKFYLSNNGFYFNMSLYAQTWKLVIFDNNYYGLTSYHEDLKNYLVSGGRLISRSWALGTASVLWDYVGVSGNGSGITTGPPTVYLWNTGHPIFNLPHDYNAVNISTSNNDFNTDYRYVEPMENATAIAGISPTQGANNSAIILSNNGRAITNAFSISQYFDDTDDSTYSDGMEIFLNEIGFLYFDRPTIDHPTDVTYMETETGNEIIWNPTASAGAWEYILSVNGTPQSAMHWDGSAITINVDGLNASITEYQLTVYDRLGYSVSDMVVLNVTEYIGPGPFGGIDPLILIAIGAGIVIIVVIIVIVMQKNKKK